jgi:hypothetical protein
MTHAIQWFFSTGIHDPAWVQAIAAVAVVVFTFVTFIVLFIYAYDILVAILRYAILVLKAVSTEGCP